MAIGYLLLGVADLRAAPLSALAAAAAAMIALAPEIVADAGFLLTVCATGAIVVAGRPAVAGAMLVMPAPAGGARRGLR